MISLSVVMAVVLGVRMIGLQTGHAWMSRRLGGGWGVCGC